MAIFDILWVCLAHPSWTALESKLPSVLPPIYEQIPDNVGNKPLFFRDKEGLCPHCEQIWLALEVKGIDYATILPSADIELQMPQITWPDGTVQTEPLEILERIEREYPYPDHSPNLYRKISKAVDSVRCNIVRFQGVFPRNTNPTILAPYLFSEDGNLVTRSDHMVTLEEIDELMEEYDDGPFLVGDILTAADLVWAPFLERYAAQLPLTYDDDSLQPRSREYEALKEWFEAMEACVPCYSCRVAGDRTSWAKVLTQAVENGSIPQVDLLPIRGKRIPTDRKSFDAQSVWKQYVENKPWMASTPEEECVAFFVRNRQVIMSDAVAVTHLGEDEVEDALREVIHFLLEHQDGSNLSSNARDVALRLDDRLRVPRDVGLLPASTLRVLVASTCKSRVKT